MRRAGTELLKDTDREEYTGYFSEQSYFSSRDNKPRFVYGAALWGRICFINYSVIGESLTLVPKLLLSSQTVLVSCNESSPSESLPTDSVEFVSQICHSALLRSVMA